MYYEDRLYTFQGYAFAILHHTLQCLLSDRLAINIKSGLHSRSFFKRGLDIAGGKKEVGNKSGKKASG